MKFVQILFSSLNPGGGMDDPDSEFRNAKKKKRITRKTLPERQLFTWCLRYLQWSRPSDHRGPWP